MTSCQLQGSEQASADSIDRGGRDFCEQAITPFFQLMCVEELHRLGKQHAGQMHPGRVGIVGVGTARFEVALVVLERAIHGNRSVAGAAIVTTRQLLCVTLRLVERQNVLAVAVLEVIGESKTLGPVGAVTVASL